MKKVKFEFHGTMYVKVRFDSGEMEIDVPDDVEDVEEFIKESEIYNDAWNEEIGHIHKELQASDLDYDEDGGDDDMDIWEDE